MTVEPAITMSAAKSADEVRVRMRCPACRQPGNAVTLVGPSGYSDCARCHFVIANQDGIWRALPPLRELYFRRFAVEYSTVREREGRGSPTAEYYLALPYQDISGRNEWQWRIRARSFDYLLTHVLPQVEMRQGTPLRVLDLGAGNGWLSYRLAQQGHDCLAIDILDNPLDGLGAARHYSATARRAFACVQAEMNNLPFADGQFDLAIFNASFHYSESYLSTMRETLRCLRRGGEVVIVDTPFYHRNESGRAMVEEKRANFQQQYGFPSDSLRSREYLTAEVLEELALQCGLVWRVGRPWYGLGWALRPWNAKLHGRREPSKFYVFSAPVRGA